MRPECSSASFVSSYTRRVGGEGKKEKRGKDQEGVWCGFKMYMTTLLFVCFLPLIYLTNTHPLMANNWWQGGFGVINETRWLLAAFSLRNVPKSLLFFLLAFCSAPDRGDGRVWEWQEPRNAASLLESLARTPANHQAEGHWHRYVLHKWKIHMRGSCAPAPPQQRNGGEGFYFIQQEA